MYILLFLVSAFFFETFAASCSQGGATGQCVDATAPNSCTDGNIVSGICAGPTNIKCCLTNYGSCTSQGVAGQCVTTTACREQGGNSASGLCPGPADVECCTKGSSSCVDGNGQAGVCISTTQCAAEGGRSEPGHCSGPADIQCCTKGNPPPPPSGITPSLGEFNAATSRSGYRIPPVNVYTAFAAQLSHGHFSSKREVAMFVAEVLEESGGFKYTSELGCPGPSCPEKSAGNYFGRGYIQLTWETNYRAASLALYGDERLVSNPDQVAHDLNVAWAVSFWYWATRVHNYPGVQEGDLSAATIAINGGCNGAAVRWNNYKNTYASFGIPGTPNRGTRC